MNVATSVPISIAGSALLTKPSDGTCVIQVPLSVQTMKFDTTTFRNKLRLSFRNASHSGILSGSFCVPNHSILAET